MKDEIPLLQILLTAIRDNDIVTASSLIASGIVDGRPHPLSLAASLCRLEIMTQLLDAGAPINAINTKGQTASHTAIAYNCVSALRLLVERGADLSVVDANGQSLLTCSIQCDDDRLAITLLDAGAPVERESPNRLVDLAAMSTALVPRLLAHNVDVGALRDTDGNTPCHRATLNDADNVVDVVRTLICVAGCDRDAACSRGRTACMNAVINANAKVLRLLIELGADVERRDDRGWTALHIVCNSSAFAAAACVELLLAAGSDCRLATDRGETACHFAVSRQSFEIVCALVAAGADVDQAADNGVTPRQLASLCGRPLPTDSAIVAARFRTDRARLDFVRARAAQVCIGLQPLNVDALQLCEVLLHSCGPVAPLVPFYHWWKIATTVKHFKTVGR